MSFHHAPLLLDGLRMLPTGMPSLPSARPATSDAQQAALARVDEMLEHNAEPTSGPLGIIFEHVKLVSGSDPPYVQPPSKLTPRRYAFPEKAEEHAQPVFAPADLLKDLDLARDESEVHYVLKKHLWCLASPEAGTSLFEYIRVRAALAACLLAAPNLADEEAPFLLACGDLTGIQSFIYSIGHKGAAKALKGRSFLLNEMLEAMSLAVLKELKLPLACRLYASGGSFYAILPNTEASRSTLDTLKGKWQKELFEIYDTDIGIVVDQVTLSASEIAQNAGDAWGRLAKCIDQEKRRPLAGYIGENRSFFETDGLSGVLVSCAATKRDLAYADEVRPGGQLKPGKSAGNGFRRIMTSTGDVYVRPEQNEVYSEEQFEAQRLGRGLRDAPFLGVFEDPNNLTTTQPFRTLDNLPSFEVRPRIQNNLRPYDAVWTINDDRFLDVETTKPDASRGWRFYGGNWMPSQPDERDEKQTDLEHIPVEYDELAEYGIGPDRLCVLRMDVDNLGQIFQIGLRDAGASLTRIVQLSAGMDFFFSSYLNRLRNLYWTPDAGITHQPSDDEAWKTADEDGRASDGTMRLKNAIQILYAGGDDLFIVGSWHVLPAVAAWIRSEFSRYTGHHPELTISAGLSLFPKKHPLFKIAETAGAAEKKAKEFRTAKDAVTWLGEPMTWKEFSQVSAWTRDLVSMITDGVGRNLLQRIGQLRASAQPKPGGTASLRWLWMAAYSLTQLARQHNRRPDVKQRIEDLASELTIQPGESDATHALRRLVLLNISARWAELLTR
ncbi:MAG: hypothetical protein AAF752_03635 [Bacteroidota bacterium]